MQEKKLWEHAKNAHWDFLVGSGDLEEGQAREQLRVKAVEKGYVEPRHQNLLRLFYFGKCPCCLPLRY